MTNPNDSAGFAFKPNPHLGDTFVITTSGGENYIPFEKGLTKRELFAYGAMRSLISNTTFFDGRVEGSVDGETYDFICKEAVHMADALIKALNENDEV
jgi:hypothetical protein